MMMMMCFKNPLILEKNKHLLMIDDGCIDHQCACYLCTRVEPKSKIQCCIERRIGLTIAEQ